ncbi:hypothetical protein [Aquiflexum sp.]|uniref:hypothetical protein n=1 Tax=Aquiflexum sp. TaxID=1872584 RepID=UPI003593A8C6
MHVNEVKKNMNDFLNIEKETDSEFERIANELLNNYAIQNHESIYRMIEIEFYWNSPQHNDDSTYKRKYVDPENGEWFFHYSGVDIGLKSEKFKGYGGILIRGIECTKTGDQYKGPMVCAMKLFSGTNAFSESIKTRIIKYDFEKKTINKTPRVGLGNNAIESKTHLLEYRFTI